MRDFFVSKIEATVQKIEEEKGRKGKKEGEKGGGMGGGGLEEGREEEFSLESSLYGRFRAISSQLSLLSKTIQQRTLNNFNNLQHNNLSNQTTPPPTSTNYYVDSNSNNLNMEREKYSLLLEDLQQVYVGKRRQLVLPLLYHSIERIGKVSSGHLPTLVRSGSMEVVRMCSKEHSLFLHFFSHPSEPLQ